MTDKRAVPADIERAAIEAANLAYGAVYGVYSEADDGEEDPVADRIVTNRYITPGWKSYPTSLEEDAE